LRITPQGIVLAQLCGRIKLKFLDKPGYIPSKKLKFASISETKLDIQPLASLSVAWNGMALTLTKCTCWHLATLVEAKGWTPGTFWLICRFYDDKDDAFPTPATALRTERSPQAANTSNTAENRICPVWSLGAVAVGPPF
jgi:hypothetical protein